MFLILNRLKMKKKISGKVLIPLLVIIIGGIAAMGYVFRTPENSVANQKAAFTVTSNELFGTFNENENNANEKFLGKIVEVSGEITEIERADKGQLMLILSSGELMGGVRCTFETNQDKVSGKVKKGEKHTIKGKCSGFLMEVVLDNCALIN